MPCLSAAQTLRGVFYVATRGIELAWLAKTLRTFGGLKTLRLPESTLLTEAVLSCEKAETSFSALRASIQYCIESVFLG